MARWLTVIVVSAALAAPAFRAWATPDLARKTKVACASCHLNPAGGPDLSDAGKGYAAHPTKPPAAAPGSDYVGANKCRTCHLNEHKDWSATAHAKALETLANAPDSTVARFAALLKVAVKGRADQSDACVTCHVTGFKLAGGYPAADSVKNSNLAFVGCESCHGPGSKHVFATLAEKKTTINRTVTERLCVRCHTKALSPDWKFAEYKMRGVHKIPEAATPEK